MILEQFHLLSSVSDETGRNISKGEEEKEKRKKKSKLKLTD